MPMFVILYIYIYIYVLYICILYIYVYILSNKPCDSRCSMNLLGLFQMVVTAIAPFGIHPSGNPQENEETMGKWAQLSFGTWTSFLGNSERKLDRFSELGNSKAGCICNTMYDYTRMYTNYMWYNIYIIHIYIYIHIYCIFRRIFRYIVFFLEALKFPDISQGCPTCQSAFAYVALPRSWWLVLNLGCS